MNVFHFCLRAGHLTTWPLPNIVDCLCIVGDIKSLATGNKFRNFHRIFDRRNYYFFLFQRFWNLVDRKIRNTKQNVKEVENSITTSNKIEIHCCYSKHYLQSNNFSFPDKLVHTLLKYNSLYLFIFIADYFLGTWQLGNIFTDFLAYCDISRRISKTIFVALIYTV